MHIMNSRLLSGVVGAAGVLALMSCSGSGPSDDGEVIGSTSQALSEEAPPEQVGAPVITPGTGTYGTPQTVTIATETEGAVIYFTIDGRSPHPETAYQYTGPFWLDTTTMVKARGYKDGLIQSPMSAARIRIVDDPSAPTVRVVDRDLTHPYRQKELIAEVQHHLPKSAKFNSFDVLAIRKAHRVDDRKDFAHRMRFGCTQYSKAFGKWIVEQYNKDSDFFKKSRAKYRKREG